ncbi:MAG: hypothetical protein ACI4WX_01745 [Aristaeellaceae bacterium]
MKKTFSFVLALLLMLSSVFAFAEQPKATQEPFRCNLYDQLLADDLRELSDAINCLDFDKIISMLDGAPESNESVQAMIELCQWGNFLLSLCTFETDKVTNEKFIKFSGLDDSFDNISIYPYIKDNQYILKMGFTGKDFIFFDAIYIAGDGMDSIYLPAESDIREVYRNGTIEEIDSNVNTYWKEDKLNSIVNAKNHIIRFANRKKEKYVDRELSETEVLALYTFEMLDRICDLLDEFLREDWNRLTMYNLLFK